jgi:hypothetical protein
MVRLPIFISPSCCTFADILPCLKAKGFSPYAHTNVSRYRATAMTSLTLILFKDIIRTWLSSVTTFMILCEQRFLSQPFIKTSKNITNI